ncbi:MAG TPA: cytidine deaminase [Bacillota bacterium]|nr:cytidine deaminase [Bacillota bacterium]
MSSADDLNFQELDDQDRELMALASAAIRQAWRTDRHSVGAAVLAGSGKVYTGVNVESCAYGPCAEPVAVGAAAAHGEREFLRIVAVRGGEGSPSVLAPCGNCRQLLADYAPEAAVVLEVGGRLLKVRAGDLLPLAYRYFR